VYGMEEGQDRNKKWTFVSVLINLRIPKKQGISRRKVFKKDPRQRNYNDLVSENLQLKHNTCISAHF
jgi:hypothetical protein